MFRVGENVEIISDGRIGRIKNTNGGAKAVNMPSAVEVVENCLVRFGNDITNEEWFKPEQLRPIKEALDRHKATCDRCIESAPGQWYLCERGRELLAPS